MYAGIHVRQGDLWGEKHERERSLSRVSWFFSVAVFALVTDYEIVVAAIIAFPFSFFIFIHSVFWKRRQQTVCGT